MIEAEPTLEKSNKILRRLKLIYGVIAIASFALAVMYAYQGQPSFALDVRQSILFSVMFIGAIWVYPVLIPVIEKDFDYQNKSRRVGLSFITFYASGGLFLLCFNLYTVRDNSLFLYDYGRAFEIVFIASTVSMFISFSYLILTKFPMK